MNDPDACHCTQCRKQSGHYFSATRVAQTKAELSVELMGSQGLGWEGEQFAPEELATVREWLSGKAISIYGGSFEVQNNIISKNILGLPETTQKG